MSAQLPLIVVPSVTLLHVPAPGVEPITLAQGDLSLTELPLDTAGNGVKTLALSVDHATFPVTSRTPLSPADTTKAHASLVFRPSTLEAAGSETSNNALGKVKIVFKDSVSPGEYEASDALIKRLEYILKEHQLWKEIGYYDEEDELDRADPQAAGYGTVIADTLSSYARLFSSKLSSFTESHVQSTSPLRPTEPGDSIKSMASSTEGFTQKAADVTHSIAQAVQTVVHDGSKYLANTVHDTANDLDKKYAGGAQPGPIREQVNETATGVKEMGGAVWEEVSLAGTGAKEAAITAGGSLSENAHKGIDHHLGPESDAVARDIGQSSANIGAAGVDAALTTMANVHVANAAVGAGEGLAGQK